MLDDILINTLMTRKVVCASPNDPLIDVVFKMRDCQYSCIVITERNTPIGILTERDVVRLFAGMDKSKTVAVAQVMTTPPITLDENATLFEALVISRAQKLRHLPVVTSNGELAGLITQTDLVQAYFQIFETQREVFETSINARNLDLIRMNEQLRALSFKDSLLDIGNRRAMEADLNHTHAVAARYGRPYSVVLFDVDHFKQYNDQYGHLAGDHALKIVSDYMKSATRFADRLYRYGGEEILLLLPETSMEGAFILAERLVKGVADLKLPHCKNETQVVTLSGGVSGYDSSILNQNLSWQDVVSLADKELYQAKQKGRNRVMRATKTEDIPLSVQ